MWNCNFCDTEVNENCDYCPTCEFAGCTKDEHHCQMRQNLDIDMAYDQHIEAEYQAKIDAEDITDWN